jgi:hypothetical protein
MVSVVQPDLWICGVSSNNRDDKDTPGLVAVLSELVDTLALSGRPAALGLGTPLVKAPAAIREAARLMGASGSSAPTSIERRAALCTPNERNNW